MAENQTPGIFNTLSPDAMSGSNPCFSGPASAWNVAFNDLKRRLWLGQNDIAKLKYENHTMTTELYQANEFIDLLQKRNEYLQLTLVARNSSYEKLEALYKEQRENEKDLHLYSKGLFDKVQRLGEEGKLFKRELTKSMDENQRLNINVESLVKEKKQLEEELENLKNIPEISISKDANQLRNNEDGGDKKTQDLISENKTLKTNIHWLSDELNKLKNEKQSVSGSNTLINGCLEEGINNHGLNMNYPKDLKGMNLPTYIRMLHNTINHLKLTLSTNSIELKKIVDHRLTKYNNLNERELSLKKDEILMNDFKNYRIPIQSNTETYEEMAKSNAEKREEHKKHFPNLWRTVARSPSTDHIPSLFKNEPNDIEQTYKNVNKSAFMVDHKNKQSNESDLPASLLYNVKLQQTQTYLSSGSRIKPGKTDYDLISSRIQDEDENDLVLPNSVELATPRYSVTGRLPFSKRIQIYDNENSFN